MRHRIGNVVSVVYSVFRFALYKIFYGKHFCYHFIERISPDVVIDIDSKSYLSMGKKVRIHSGSRITCAKGAKVKIGDNCRINNNCRIASRCKVILGNGVELGPGVLLYDHDHDFRCEGGIKAGKYKTSDIIIGDNVWIGAGSIILRGSVIEEGCIVGAGSVIKGSFKPNSVIVQKRKTEVFSYEIER